MWSERAEWIWSWCACLWRILPFLDWLSLWTLHVLADLRHHLMIRIAWSENVLIRLSNLLSFRRLTLHKCQSRRWIDRTNTSSECQIKLFFYQPLNIMLLGHFFILWTDILVFNWMIGMKSSLIQTKIADPESRLHFLTRFLFSHFHKFVQDFNFVVVWNWKLEYGLTIVFDSLWDETVTAGWALFLETYF